MIPALIYHNLHISYENDSCMTISCLIKNNPPIRSANFDDGMLVLDEKTDFGFVKSFLGRLIFGAV